jgi:predicted protein tyrosine phosphatase
MQTIVVPNRQPYQGERFTYLVLSRQLAQARTLDRPYIVISIGDPDLPPAEIAESEHRIDVLRMYFWDLTERKHGMKPMTIGNARKIAAFVKAHEGTAQGILLHCQAGISRSAGVATAIARHYGDDDTFFYRHYCPNHHVRNLVSKALTEISG